MSMLFAGVNDKTALVEGREEYLAVATDTCADEQREHEAPGDDSIMEAEVERFDQNLGELELCQEIGEMRHRLEEIAHAELARQRRRLGKLSPEQERAVETLLISTVNQISHPVIQQMRRSFEAGQTELAEIWLDAFVPAH